MAQDRLEQNVGKEARAERRRKSGGLARTDSGPEAVFKAHRAKSKGGGFKAAGKAILATQRMKSIMSPTGSKSKLNSATTASNAEHTKGHGAVFAGLTSALKATPTDNDTGTAPQGAELDAGATQRLDALESAVQALSDQLTQVANAVTSQTDLLRAIQAHQAHQTHPADTAIGSSVDASGDELLASPSEEA